MMTTFLKNFAVYLLLSLPTGALHAQKAPRFVTHLITQDLDPASLGGEALLINSLIEMGYHKCGKDSLLHVMLQAVWKERDSIMAIYPREQQKMIGYHYANKLFDFSNAIRNRFSRTETWKIIADTAVKTVSLPDLDLLANSSAANIYLKNYVSNELVELFLQTRECGDSIMEKKMELPVQELKRQAERYGETFLAIDYARKVLPASLYEQYLVSQILDNLDNGNMNTAKAIFSVLQTRYPKSSWIFVCKNEIASLEAIIEKQKQNTDITFLENPDHITGLKELIKPFAGKVIYLDIWGTWCGPCIDEIIRHTPALKEHFKDEKDLVFLYLAQENPVHLQKWKEFILLHGITGYHLHKTNYEMEPFWVELLGTVDIPRSFPTYVIFNKEGELVTYTAKRPSNGPMLYTYLEELLK